MKKLFNNFGIALVVVFASVVRLVSINQSLWLDEATSALAAKLSLHQLFNSFFPGDFHPPLYYLLLKLWSGVFGFSEVSLRMPSVIFGVATVFLIYLIGKKLFNERVGLIASTFLATSGLHIYYSQEARMYSLAALLVALAVYLFLQESWVLFSVILVFLGMTDYVSLIIVPVFIVYALVSKRSGMWWKGFLLSHVPLIAIFGLWLPIFITQLKSGIELNVTAPGWWSILGQVTLKNIALIPIKFIFGRVSVDNRIIYAIGVSVVGSIFGYLLLRAKKITLVHFWLIGSLILGIILSFFIPTLAYFRYLFILPAFYLILAEGVSTLSKKWLYVSIGFLLFVNLTSSFAYLLLPGFHREDWRSLVSFVESKKTTKSITMFVADSNMEAYRYYSPDAKIAGPEGVESGYDQVWLMRYVKDVFDPGGKVRASVENLSYRNVGEYDFNGVGVWEYTK